MELVLVFFVNFIGLAIIAAVTGKTTKLKKHPSLPFHVTE